MRTAPMEATAQLSVHFSTSAFSNRKKGKNNRNEYVFTLYGMDININIQCYPLPCS